MKRKNGP